MIELGSSIEIKQGNLSSLPPVKDIKNEWDLQLGNAPMDLVVAAGAYEGTIRAGRPVLESLDIKDGASNVDLSFSKANPVEMSILRYATGASDCQIDRPGQCEFLHDDLFRRRGKLHPRL